MRKYPKCVYVWDGSVMMPTLHFARLAESSFTSGQAYRMIVDEELSAHKVARRTQEQNRKMWAMLADIAEQAEHCGRRYSTDEWKVLLMHACGHEVKFLPALDNKTFVPYGGRSSHMTIAQMTELIEFMHAFGAQQSITFRDEEGLSDARR